MRQGRTGRDSAHDERITEMLEKLKDSPNTLNRLMERVYEDIRRIAHFEQDAMNVPKIQTTVLVHEVYLKLFSQDMPEIRDESHFKRMTAQIVRHLIVDRVRTFMAQKRGGGAHHTALDDKKVSQQPAHEDLEAVVAVEEVIRKLEQTDERLAEVVIGTYYAGYSATELAEMTGRSRRTIQRDLKRARGWLKLEMDPSRFPDRSSS